VSLTSQIGAFRALLETGAAALFQAIQGGSVLSSNMILLAPQAGYNHTQGTHPDGMACGAAHFLLREIALHLKAEGKRYFNLGGTDQLEGGLERFKTGFSADTLVVAVDAAEFRLGGAMRKLSLAAASLLRAAP
jgi:lipid II:glycine glycyltransferase (peptidoglycan interpeptide bridge formation enzyme)